MIKLFVDYLREILLEYSNGITLEELEKILNDRCIKLSINDIVSHSDYFYINDNTVFLKESLNEHKRKILNEFEDYMRGKVLNGNLLTNITKLLDIFLPDIIYIEWMNISFETKIIIFELLYSIYIRPKNSKDELKNFFIDLINGYSLLAIYSLLLLRNYNEELDGFIGYIERIERFEENICSLLFKILTDPIAVKENLKQNKKDFSRAEFEVELIIQNSFSTVLQYSESLVKRVVENELENFESFSILARFEYNSFYEWLMVISENNDFPYNGDLFYDLNL